MRVLTSSGIGVGMTRLVFLGHASFLFETEKAAVLIDPWCTEHGAFLGSWRQLPPNRDSLQFAMGVAQRKPTVIYVTHEHEDHYDERTLKALLPYCKGLFTANYENSFLVRLIDSNLNVQPTLLNENEPYGFHDIELRVFIDESGINRDSAIFLRCKDLSFFDANDCKIYDRALWLREVCQRIDVLTVQFSGANMHPITYDMEETSYRRVSREKRMRKFVAVRNFINDLDPKYYVPSAGPAIFPFAEHFPLNFEKDGIFPKWWEFQAYLSKKSRAAEFVPLDVLGSVEKGTDGSFKIEGLSQVLDDAELSRIVEEYRKFDLDRGSKLEVEDSVCLSFFETEMQRKCDVLKRHPKIQFACPVYFEIQTSKEERIFYRVHSDAAGLAKVMESEIVEPYYLHRTTTKSIARLIDSGKGWGTYYLSFQFSNKRVPDVFDSAMATFFVANDDEDLDFGLRKLLEFRESEEYVVLTTADKQISISCKRFCPHQGGDLKYAKFDGRYVVCPRHQWRFDCQNGGVADNSRDSISATYLKT